MKFGSLYELPTQIAFTLGGYTLKQRRSTSLNVWV